MHLELVAEREKNTYEFERKEISCSRNLLIYTLADCKHRQGDENEPCGFLCISVNKASLRVLSCKRMEHAEALSFRYIKNKKLYDFLLMLTLFGTVSLPITVT